MPHKENVNKHLWQEMEFILNLLDKEDRSLGQLCTPSLVISTGTPSIQRTHETVCPLAPYTLIISTPPHDHN